MHQYVDLLISFVLLHSGCCSNVGVATRYNAWVSFRRFSLQFYMHGNNLTTLHAHIHRDALPADQGGSAPPYNTESWAKVLVGDDQFSYGQNHIFWPDHCSSFK
jgi:hypothetical protein